MTKREFIWLVIRAVGLFKLILSVRFVFSAITLFLVILTILPADDVSGKVVFMGLFGMFLESIFEIIIVIYLLLFGKTIFYIVHRTSHHASETVLENMDHLEILIRFIGVWWLWRIVCQIFRLASGLLYATTLSHPEWFNKPGSDTSNLQALMEQLGIFLHPIQQQTIWSISLNVIIYSVLAWYFLKHGRFFMNLLNRLWRDKETEKANHTPLETI